MILGADFSSLEETERLGGRFWAEGGEWDLVELLASRGVSSARLRLWDDPFDEAGEPYGGGCCDIGRVTRLARRARDVGMGLLLDLHYSDFWSDPSRQLPPKAWRGKTVAEISKCVYDSTAKTLDRLGRLGLAPMCVQVGNEITNGMLWPFGKLSDETPRTGFDELAGFLRAGAAAVRESSGAKVLLHLERSGDKALWTEWLDAVTAREVDFDVIGASYYPHWHGGLPALRDNLTHCAKRYGKSVWIVETAYPFTTQHYDPAADAAALSIADGERNADGSPCAYPITPAGQAAFLRDMLALASSIPGEEGGALYWWEPGWLPVPGSSWASEGALRYAGEGDKPLGNEWANQCLFDYHGRALPALDEFLRF